MEERRRQEETENGGQKRVSVPRRLLVDVDSRRTLKVRSHGLRGGSRETVPVTLQGFWVRSSENTSGRTI